jgi:hypothetical protein
MTMDALGPFLGTWDMEAVFPSDSPVPPIEGEVTTVFEWVLDGQFLLQRSEAPAPIPKGLCLIGWDEATDGFTQHYFDARGVARVYAMTFDGRTWTLERSAPDFSPLDFQQRYLGTFSADGRDITGRWEICDEGSTWRVDFELSFHRR